MISERIKKIDTFLQYVAGQINFSARNPTNITSAYLKFKKTKQAPQFKYNQQPDHVLVLKGILKEIHLGDTFVERILDNKRKDLILKIELLASVGTPRFSTVSKKLYSPPNATLVKKAYEILKLKPDAKQKNIKRKDAVKMIRGAFNLLGMKWKILSRDMSASASVIPSRRLLKLRKKERFSELFVRRLIVHEIGVHAIRAENGALQPLHVFFDGFAGYLETEEGLAAYAEDLAGLMNNSKMRNYAGRVVAVHYALSHGFVDTYKHLKKYFSDKMAWKMTLRAKRGLADTSLPGAFTKDVLYLRGFYKVKRFIKKGGKLEDLYVGKIGLDDVNAVQQVPGLKKARYLLYQLLEQEEKDQG